MKRLISTLLVCAALCGCGGSGGGAASDAGGGTPVTSASTTSTATLDLSLLTKTAIPENVTALQLIGTDASGAVVFTSQVAPASASRVTVPSSVRSVEIHYLSGNEPVGWVAFDVDLQPGQTFSLPQPDVGIPTAQALKLDILINADMWETTPRMIAAGLGFTHIIGVPGIDLNDLGQSEAVVRAAGGTWNTVDCTPSGDTPGLGAYTSATTPQGVAALYGVPVVLGDGLPVEFSWPIRPSTLDPTDFKVTLNDGSEVTPQAAAIVPNYDYNERAVAVLFGQFGNRFGPDDPRARWAAKVEVVADATPLQLIGPGGRPVSAVGMSANAGGTPYTDPDVPPAQRGGPHLVGAKLTRLSAVGDAAPSFLANASPNDGVTLYGGAGQYRIRVYTSGGFSPDGVRGVYPTEYERYFRLQAKTASGRTVLLEKTGVPYDIDGGTVEVLGLAELGHSEPVYDDCYVEDQDNQIDIILSGDERAVRRISAVEVPSVAPYSPFYNPGGPGNNPTPGVRYSAPSPPHTQPILVALDDPLTVTFIDLRSRGPLGATPSRVLAALLEGRLPGL